MMMEHVSNSDNTIKNIRVRMKLYRSNKYRYLLTYFDRSLKNQESILVKKKPTGFIYLTGSQLCHKEINVELRLFLK